ncbi:Uncharacterised protein [Shigella sonnei]|nr:Uncharacterised protein [Shigella sonnei]
MFTQSMTFIGSLDSLSLETNIRRRADARRGTRSGPGSTPSVFIPRSIHACMVCQTCAKYSSISFLLCSASSFCIARPDSE